MTYFTDGFIADQPVELLVHDCEPGLSRSSLRVARLFNLIKDPKKEFLSLNKKFPTWIDQLPSKEKPEIVKALGNSLVQSSNKEQLISK
jgi:hypothetical protein